MPLTCLQNRFISKCRKDPKPILEMLKDCQVGIGTFLKWRLDSEFSRQFKLATTGVTDDMLAELRMAFAVSGRLVSADVFSTALKRNAPKPRGKQAKKRAATSRRRRQLTPTQHRRCIDVLKIGMTAFVPKTLPRKKRSKFPEPHPEAYARLKKEHGLKS